MYKRQTHSCVCVCVCSPYDDVIGKLCDKYRLLFIWPEHVIFLYCCHSDNIKQGKSFKIIGQLTYIAKSKSLSIVLVGALSSPAQEWAGSRRCQTFCLKIGIKIRIAKHSFFLRKTGLYCTSSSPLQFHYQYTYIPFISTSRIVILFVEIVMQVFAVICEAPKIAIIILISLNGKGDRGRLAYRFYRLKILLHTLWKYTPQSLSVHSRSALNVSRVETTIRDNKTRKKLHVTLWSEFRLYNLIVRSDWTTSLTNNKLH